MVLVTAEGGLAQGVIEDLDFPTSVVISKDVDWSTVVHNVGGTGGLAFGIVNEAGNPGDIVVTYAGGETTVSPGYYLRLYKMDQVYCTRLELAGMVRFLVKGSYTMKFWGMHEDAGTWTYDDQQTRTVVVSDIPEPEPTIFEQIVEFIQDHPTAIAASIITPIGLMYIERKGR